MYRLPSRALAALGVLAVLLVAGCASTQITNAWRDPDYTGPGMRKLLVLGVSSEGGVRRTFEDEFARGLAAAGVDALPSYRVLPQDGQIPDGELRAAVERVGADGVLITRLVRIERQTDVYPGHVTVMPAFGYHRSFYGYYGSTWAYVTPPTVHQYDVVTLETNLWNARKENLIWSATTRSFAPSDVRKATQDFAGVVVRALRAQALI